MCSALALLLPFAFAFFFSVVSVVSVVARVGTHAHRPEKRRVQSYSSAILPNAWKERAAIPVSPCCECVPAISTYIAVETRSLPCIPAYSPGCFVWPIILSSHCSWHSFRLFLYRPLYKYDTWYYLGTFLSPCPSLLVDVAQIRGHY